MTNRPLPRPIFRLVGCTLALTLGSSTIAAAAPAIAIKDANARSAPFNVAPVVGQVHGGEHVEVDEPPSNGWWRVHLTNGKTGFVPEDGIQVAPAAKVGTADSPAGADAAQPAARAAAASGEPIVHPIGAKARAGRPPVYVADFSQLAALVKSDADVFALADAVATRYSASQGLIWGGLFGGLALNVAAGVIATKSRDAAILTSAVGTTVFILGPLIGLCIRPSTWDRTDVVNAWNAKHPDQPFVDRTGVEAP